MFSTILKEITGYFDRNALVSAFFPNLIFWGGLAIFSTVRTWGWTGSLEKWKALAGSAEAVVLILFLAGVAFLSIVILTFQPALLRLYEGNWPVEPLARWRRLYWRRKYEQLDQRDRTLETWELSLETDSENAAKFILQWLEPPDGAHASSPKHDLQEIVGLLDRICEDLSGFKIESEPPATEDVNSWDVPRLAHDLRSKIQSGQHASHDKRAVLAEEIKAQAELLRRKARKNLADVKAQRRFLKNELALRYPEQASDVMPAKLGNIFRAAEDNIRLRYLLDPAVVWSRLQPMLDKDAGESLQSSRTWLDFLITLSHL